MTAAGGELGDVGGTARDEGAFTRSEKKPGEGQAGQQRLSLARPGTRLIAGGAA